MKKKILSVLLFACTVNTHAAIVTWNFSGTSGGVAYPAGTTNTLDGMIDYGTAFTGSITFDDSGVPDRLTSDETNYSQIYNNILDFNVDFAPGYNVHGDGGSFNLNGNMAVTYGTDAGTRVDEMVMSTSTFINGDRPTVTTNLDGFFVDNMMINFRDASGAFYGDKLPDLSTFVMPDHIRDPYLSMWFSDGQGNFKANMSMRLDSVSVSAVPVPAAVWLFGSGLLGLIGVSRRKK